MAMSFSGIGISLFIQNYNHFNDNQLDGLNRLMSDDVLIDNTYDGALLLKGYKSTRTSLSE